MTERMSGKRIKKVLLIFLVMAVFSLLLGVIKGILIDRLLCLALLDLVFFSILFFMLENERLAGKLSGNRTTDYRRVLTGVTASSIACLACGFFPEFMRPVLIIPIIMTAFSSEWIGICVSLYDCVILALVCEMSSSELTACLILILTASMLFKAWEKQTLKKGFLLCLCCLQTVIPPVFYYWYYREHHSWILPVSAGTGIALAVVFYHLYDKIWVLRSTEISDILQDMLSEEHPLLKDLQHFSQKEYEHGRLVSKVAGKCAQVAGADEMLCTVGGLYYRIGILKGEQIAENGAYIANEHCFPEKVYQILKEYHGVNALPSTLESAIVQMVDGVVNQIELMYEKDVVNDWNKDMAVYHTLTEFSSKGMYDKAGVNVNKFLKIREYLAKEDLLK